MHYVSGHEKCGGVRRNFQESIILRMCPAICSSSQYLKTMCCVRRSSALQQQQQRDTNNVLDGKHSVDDGSTRLTDATEGVWKDGRHRFGDRRADEVSPAVSTAAGRISALAGATVPAAMLSSSTSTIAATTLCVERDKIEVVRGDPNNER